MYLTATTLLLSLNFFAMGLFLGLLLGQLRPMDAVGGQLAQLFHFLFELSGSSGNAVGALQLPARLIAHVLRRQMVAFALERARGKLMCARG